ncbi:MAG: UDP-glucose 4-epimerase GalE [Candidatus Doudnabacteria bacterium]|nr:UDP-glucose 4-epimerase GalE [Candidatus Doudnabacteria bacterium]
MLVFEHGEPRLVILDPKRYPNLFLDKEVNPSGLEEKVRGAKILVTGGAGYIGSVAVENLLASGYDVVVLDNLSSGKASNVSCPLIVGDIGDPKTLDKLFSEHQIDAVMHFAAFVKVEESVKFPEKYFQNNVVNSLALLNSMLKHGVKKLIFSSSAAVYGQPSSIPITEKHPCFPTNPYGESKLMFEKIIQWYSKVHGISAVILRYFNAAGASISGNLGEIREDVTHLIPKVLQVAAQQEEELRIFGQDYPTFDGTAVRDYVHVDDLALAHILALDKLTKDQGVFTYNIGTGTGYSVNQVVDCIMEQTGKMIMTEHAPRREGDPASLVADASLAFSELGFAAQYSDLPTIVDTAWSWHKKRFRL